MEYFGVDSRISGRCWQKALGRRKYVGGCWQPDAIAGRVGLCTIHLCVYIKHNIYMKRERERKNIQKALAAARSAIVFVIIKNAIRNCKLENGEEQEPVTRRALFMASSLIFILRKLTVVAISFNSFPSPFHPK